MPSKKNQLFIVILFLLSLTLPITLSDKTGGKYSATEKRKLATFPEIITKEMRFAGGIKTNGEKWLDDNIGLRSQAKLLLTYFDYSVFGVSPSRKVLIGKEGWYYYTRNNNIAIGLGTYTLTKAQMEEIKINQEAIQAALKKKGIEYVITLIPSKVSVYPEYIGGSPESSATLIDIVSEYLIENTTIPVINTKHELIKAKDTSPVYFKTDTHWNEIGSFVGYSTIINKLNQYGIINSSPVPIMTSTETHVGDLTALMGMVGSLPSEPFKAIRIMSPAAVRVENGDDYDELNSMISKNYGNVTFYSYRNEKVNEKEMLIFGDSFFVSYKTPELLAENFSVLNYVNSYKIRKDLVDLLQPDVVMFEITEREIEELSTPVDPELFDAP